jgi:hypothetical protein
MNSAHVGVQAGDGVVARFESAVIVAATGAGSDAFTGAVLDALEDPGLDPSAVAWRVAELLVAHHADAPAFGMLIPETDGVRVFVHGAARAIVDDAEVPGDGAATWVDRLVAGPFERIAVTLAPDGPVEPDPRSDLREGLVRGGGLVFTVGDGEARSGAEPATGSEPAVQPSLDPLPPPPPPPPPPATAPAGPSAGETVELRDIVSALRSDDGSRIPLDRSYVFGRDPQLDPSVANGDASPIRLADPEHLISRVQAYVFVDAKGTTITDVRSANGTFVAPPGAPDWTRLGDAPAPLPIGWSVRMGRRVFTHVDAGG